MREGGARGVGGEWEREGEGGGEGGGGGGRGMRLGRDYMLMHVYIALLNASYSYIYKASQPRGWASGSRAYGRHEMQGVIFKSTRHECSVFVNLRPLLLRIRSRHQFSSPEKTGSHCGIHMHHCSPLLQSQGCRER